MSGAVLFTYVQRSRLAKNPPNVVYFVRPYLGGNPFKIGKWIDTKDLFSLTVREQQEFASRFMHLASEQNLFVVKANNAPDSVDLYRFFFNSSAGNQMKRDIERAIAKHPGTHIISCWCKYKSPCHVQDVILPWINGERRKYATAHVDYHSNNFV